MLKKIKVLPGLIFHLAFIMIQVFAVTPGTSVEKKPAGIWVAEWSPDGTMIAVAGDDSIVWIYDQQQVLRHSYKMTGMVKALNWHPVQHTLAIATMQEVGLLNANTGSLKRLSPGTGGRAIAWNFNGELLGLADGNGQVQIMDTTGNLLKTITKHNSNTFFAIDWHPQKNILLTGSDEIMMFDTTGKQLALIYHRAEHTGVLTVKWHPSGTFFAVGDYGHDGEGIPALLQYWTTEGKLLKTIQGHRAEIRCLRWSHDGQRIATASDALRIWSKEGVLLHESRSGPVMWGLTWRPDGQQLVTGCFENGALQLWNAEAELLAEF